MKRISGNKTITTQCTVDFFKAKEGTGMDFSDLITITSTSSQRDEHQGMQIDPDSPREGPSSSR